MPKLWRYICQQTLMLIAAVTALLTGALILLRPDEITRLASVSSSWRQMGLFFLITLPYLLPVALPLATFIACGLMTSQMIRKNEWLALTSLGFSPFQICAPLVSLLFIVGGSNALICSELVQKAHLTTERLKLDWAALRPLRALQPREPLRLGRIAVAAGDRKGESLDQFLLCYARPSPKEEFPSLELIFAKGLNFKSNSFEMLDQHSIHFKKNPSTKSPTDFFVQRAQRANISISMVRSLLAPRKKETIPLGRLNLKHLWQVRKQHTTCLVRVELIRRASSVLLPIALGLLGLWTGALASLAHCQKTLALALICSLMTFLSPYIGKICAVHWQWAAIAYFALPLLAIAVGLRGLTNLRLG